MNDESAFGTSSAVFLETGSVVAGFGVGCDGAVTTGVVSSTLEAPETDRSG